MTREPTLPLLYALHEHPRDFTSPVGTRIRLYWLALTFRARPLRASARRTYATDRPIALVKGWHMDGGHYVVTRLRLRAD